MVSSVSASAPVTGPKAPSTLSIGGRPTCRCKSEAFFLITSSSSISIRGCAAVIFIPTYPLLLCAVGCGHPVYFFERSKTCQSLQITIFLHGNHALGLGGSLDVSAG